MKKLSLALILSTTIFVGCESKQKVNEKPKPKPFDETTEMLNNMSEDFSTLTFKDARNDQFINRYFYFGKKDGYDMSLWDDVQKFKEEKRYYEGLKILEQILPYHNLDDGNRVLNSMRMMYEGIKDEKSQINIDFVMELRNKLNQDQEIKKLNGMCYGRVIERLPISVDDCIKEKGFLFKFQQERKKLVEEFEKREYDSVNGKAVYY